MNTKVLNSIKVEQIINSNDNPAANQFVIRVDGGIVFQSYDSIIATVDYDKQVITIYPDWNYSNTTGKHRNIFFSDYVHFKELSCKKGIEEYLQKGEYRGWKIRRK